MTDSPQTLSTIDTSKLYQLARQTPLLEFLVPDLPTQLQIGLEIEDTFKREDDDGDDTRILINYRNLKGNSVLYKFLDHERLSRQFNIDGFMDGFMQSIQKEPSVDVSLDAINATILAALLLSVTTVLGLNTEEGVTKNTEEVSKVVLSSLTSILFNDALDVMIAVQEQQPEGQTDSEVVIAGVWIVAQRYVEGVNDPDTIHALNTDQGNWQFNTDEEDTKTIN